MSRYRITRTDDLPDEIKKIGGSHSIIIECESSHIPLFADIESSKDTTAHFNGFPFELMPHDKIEQIDWLEIKQSKRIKRVNPFAIVFTPTHFFIHPIGMLCNLLFKIGRYIAFHQFIVMALQGFNFPQQFIIIHTRRVYEIHNHTCLTFPVSQ